VRTRLSERWACLAWEGEAAAALRPPVCGPIRRRCRDANVSKGRDLTKAVGASLKTDFETYLNSADASASEVAQRRMQLNRFAKEYKAAVESFNDAATAAVTGMKKFPVPANTAAASDAAGTGAAGGDDAKKPRRNDEESRLCVSGGGGGAGESGHRSVACRRTLRSPSLKPLAPGRLQQLQQVDLTESLLHEREAAIDEITASMVEVRLVGWVGAGTYR
jgi:hypothetical protein